MLRIFHVNGIAGATVEKLQKTAPIPRDEWRVIIQIFADDISAAISHRRRKTTSALAHGPTDSLLRELKELDLDASAPKCRNFLVDGNQREHILVGHGDRRNRERELKEQNRYRMSQDLDKLQSQTEGDEAKVFPLKWV